MAEQGQQSAYRHSYITVIPLYYRHSRRPSTVIPAQAGIQDDTAKTSLLLIGHFWIPACAGMTVGDDDSICDSPAAKDEGPAIEQGRAGNANTRYWYNSPAAGNALITPPSPELHPCLAPTAKRRLMPPIISA